MLVCPLTVLRAVAVGLLISGPVVRYIQNLSDACGVDSLVPQVRDLLYQFQVCVGVQPRTTFCPGWLQETGCLKCT